MNKLVSIIVPIYNVEAFLRRCIDSILQQTYENLEVILVDDGSEDKSSEICDEYKEKDKRIVVIHKNNGGQSSARNCGLDIAKGEYIAFVDSDDFIDSRMIEIIIKNMEKYDADVGGCGYARVTEVFHTGNIVLRENEKIEISIWSEEEAILNLSKSSLQVWNKIYRFDKFRELRFKEKQLYEDIDYCKNVYKRMNKMVFVDIPLYQYIVSRPGNTISSFKEERINGMWEMKDFLTDIKKRNLLKAYQVLAKFSLGFYIALYFDAYRFALPDKVLSQIEEEFHSIYKTCQGKQKWYVMLFRLNPKIAYWINIIIRKTKRIVGKCI